MIRKIINIIFFFMCVQILFPQTLLANKITSSFDQGSLKSIALIPIQENGRLKPLDTFANNTLLRFSGKKQVVDKAAIAWLSQLIFQPEATQNDLIFLINHPSIPESLGIPPRKRRLYSFNELKSSAQKLFDLATKANQIQPEQRDIIENEIIRVYQNIEFYSKLSLATSFAADHPDFTLNDSDLKESLNLNTETHQYSYLDMALRAKEFHQLTEPLVTLNKDYWTLTNRQTMQIVNNLFHWSMLYHDFNFDIIPPYQADQTTWNSPWDTLNIAIKNPEGRRELALLQKMRKAFVNNDSNLLANSSKEFKNLVLKRATENGFRTQSIVWEYWFNQWNVFSWAKLIFLIIIFMCLFNIIFPKLFIYRIAFILLLIASILTTTGVLLRMYILWRPPVSNLYETFVFVALVSSWIGLLLEKLLKNYLGLAIGAISGYIFLTIAGKFAVEGDTLEVLVAVLNSNFWLSTHVLSIVIGYSGVCLAGITAHIYILQRIFRPQNKKRINQTYSVLLGTLGFGLTMTFLGTNLGGIWADQSWGRFWGWDPKENGALMIVLWCALLFHLKVGRLIGPIGMAFGAIFALIVVMWAWFGVNLLNVGLHSYGFTKGLASNLLIYLIIQLIIIIFFKILLRKQA